LVPEMERSKAKSWVVRDLLLDQYIAGGLLSAGDALGDNAPLIIECDAASTIIIEKHPTTKPRVIEKSPGKSQVRLELVGNSQVVLHYNGSDTPVLRGVVTTNGRHEII
jgi:hypothetical protein